MISACFENLKAFLNKGRYLCVNLPDALSGVDLQSKFSTLLSAAGYGFYSNIYWIKPTGAVYVKIKNPFPRQYRPATHNEVIKVFSFEEMPETAEPILTFKYSTDATAKHGGARQEEKIPDIMLGQYIGNVWKMTAETTQQQLEHPAMFPIQLPFNCIRFFSFEGENVMDFFMGAGTTLLAAEQLNRNFYGIELDPKHINTTIKRYKEMKPSAQISILKAKK